MKRSLPWLLAALLATGGCAGPATRSGTPASSDAAQLNLRLGLEYMRRGRIGVAEEKLQKSISLDDRIPQAHNALAVLYTDRGQFDEAESHYRRALSLDGNFGLARSNYGDMLCRAGRHAEGIGEYTRIIDRSQGIDRLRAMEGRGVCRIASGDLDAAERDLREVLETDRFAQQALLGLAEISLLRGDALAARGFLQRREATAPVSAKSLWLGYQIESALGAAAAQDSYAVRLRTDFPDSHEASQLRRLMR